LIEEERMENGKVENLFLKDSEAWRNFARHPESIATCMSPSWLLDGCPKCGNKTWNVTSDCWAYCDKCFKGFPTNYPFTKSGEIVSKLP
jgi:hypothetical protein